MDCARLAPMPAFHGSAGEGLQGRKVSKFPLKKEIARRGERSQTLKF